MYIAVIQIFLFEGEIAIENRVTVLPFVINICVLFSFRYTQSMANISKNFHWKIFSSFSQDIKSCFYKEKKFPSLLTRHTLTKSHTTRCRRFSLNHFIKSRKSKDLMKFKSLRFNDAYEIWVLNDKFGSTEAKLFPAK